MKTGIARAIYASLQREIADVVESTCAAAARSVNVLMTATYWEMGRRIVEFEQGGEGRAPYGEGLIRHLGTDFSKRWGFGWRNLAQMQAFISPGRLNGFLQTLSAKIPGCSNCADAVCNF